LANRLVNGAAEAPNRTSAREGETDDVRRRVDATGVVAGGRHGRVVGRPVRQGKLQEAGHEIKLTTEERRCALEAIDEPQWPARAEDQLTQLRAALLASLRLDP